MGAVPLHWLLVRQETQVPLPVLQYGVAPVQAAKLDDEHCPQAPDGSHAGVDPPHSPSPEQPRQPCEVVSQTGAVEAAQSVLARQETQVPFAARQIGVPPVHCALFVLEH